MQRALRAAWTPSILAGSVVGLSLVGALVGQTGFVVTTLIYMMVVVGLWTFVGVSGVISFGHIGFMAIGAYLAGLLSIPAGTRSLLLSDLPGVLGTAEPPALLTILIAAGVVAAFAFVVGIPLMRLSGLAASISTLALFVIVVTLITETEAIGGAETVTGIPVSSGLVNTLVATVVIILAAGLFSASRVGLRLRASREDLVAARALGVRDTRVRLVAFVLSAAMVAVGGAFYARDLGSISPEAFSFNLTFLTIAMLVVGGRTSLTGAIGGTVFLSLVIEVFRRLEDSGALPAGYQQVTLAVIVIATLALRPRGISNGREIPTPWKEASPR